MSYTNLPILIGFVLVYTNKLWGHCDVFDLLLLCHVLYVPDFLLVNCMYVQLPIVVPCCGTKTARIIH